MLWCHSRVPSGAATTYPQFFKTRADCQPPTFVTVYDDDAQKSTGSPRRSQRRTPTQRQRAEARLAMSSEQGRSAPVAMPETLTRFCRPTQTVAINGDVPCAAGQ